jgi:ATP adenylyltransferase
MSNTPVFFEPTLLDHFEMATRRALAAGALHLPEADPIEELMEDGGIPFLVRVVPHLSKRIPLAGKTPLVAPSNPFLPYDDALFVENITDTYVCLLNKYSALNLHTLLVTRTFVDQAQPLNLADFIAIHQSLSTFDGLIIFNCGKESGGSQPHRHIHFLPHSYHAQARPWPIEDAVSDLWSCFEIRQIPIFPFLHSIARLEHWKNRDPVEQAILSLELYQQMLIEVGLQSMSDPVDRLGDYNLLMNRRWMMLIPRCRSSYGDISINGLGFSGLLLVTDKSHLQTIKTAGPLSVLASLGYQESTS